jgi:hypothetical protein
VYMNPEKERGRERWKIETEEKAGLGCCSLLGTRVEEVGHHLINDMLIYSATAVAFKMGEGRPPNRAVCSAGREMVGTRF